MEENQKTEMPVFSVVIISYRSGELWKQAVSSVLSQDYQAIELILADDGTPDFSCAEAEKFIAQKCGSNLVRSRVISSECNNGTVQNLNKADQYCSGAYLLHFAADDALAHNGVLTVFADTLQHKKPGVLGVYGRSECCDDQLRPVGSCSFDPVLAERMNSFSAREQWKRLCQGCCLHLGATAFLREEYLRTDGFDPRFRLMEDWPFLLKCTRQGYLFEFIDLSALLYRQGGVTKRKPTPSYRSLMTDHLLNYEMNILPASAELDRMARWKVWMRYLDDRMDGRKLFGELSAVSYGKLRGFDAHAVWYLPMWWIKRNRRQIGVGLLTLLCLIYVIITLRSM